MATDPKDMPPASQQSTSDLSDPPEFSEDEMREIVVNMAPITRRQSDYAVTITQTETNMEEPPLKSPGGDNASVNDEDKLAVEINVSPRPTRQRVPSRKRQLSDSKPTASRRPAGKRPKANTKKWEPDYVTQDSKSPLVGRDLRALLLHPQAWDLLAAEDKKEILALFPDEKHILEAGTENARPDVLSLQNDDNFRHDTEDYVSNLSKDMHHPIWLQDAWAAHGSRAAGNYDQFYIRRLEVEWKTTIPDDMKPESLRSSLKDKNEDSSVVRQPPDGGKAAAAEATIDGAAGDGAVSVGDVANLEVGNLDVRDTIIVLGANNSAETEDDTNGTGNMEAGDVRTEVLENDAEDGPHTNDVDGIEKVPEAKVDETDGGDSNKMQTGPE